MPAYIPTTENCSDLFTKNLGGESFDKHTQVYCGIDEYSGKIETKKKKKKSKESNKRKHLQDYKTNNKKAKYETNCMLYI